MSKIIKIDFSGNQFDFRDDGWFNATLAADKFGKRPVDWLNQRDTAEYIAALSKHINSNCDFLEQFSKIILLDGVSAASQAKLLRLVKQTGLVKTKQGAIENGGGTWMHPKLAVSFTRWLDVKFSIWCDMQIDNLLRGESDWRKLRHEAASSFKVMNSVLLLQRQMQGKVSASHHFSNEARLVNWALMGKFEGIDRNSLAKEELDLLAKLEERNAVLIGCGLDYAERKPLLERFVSDWRKPLALESVA